MRTMVAAINRSNIVTGKRLCVQGGIRQPLLGEAVGRHPFGWGGTGVFVLPYFLGLW